MQTVLRRSRLLPRCVKVKDAALGFFGRSTLDGSLNGDEAAALGATL